MAGILGIIPARGGSKGLKNKNIMNLANTPLIAYTIRECEKSKHIQRHIVSTDSKEVARVAGLYNAKVLMRPAELARDDTSMAAVVKHALEDLKNAAGDMIPREPIQFLQQGAARLIANVK